MKLLKNCSLISDNQIINRDILIDEDTIVEIAEKIQKQTGWEEIDLDYKFVLPGFIDFHVHLDDEINGAPIADNYDSGTRVALKSGITTLFSFITQRKGETLRDAVNRTHEKAKGNLWCDVGWHLTPTTFDEESHTIISELIEEGFNTFKLYTTYKKAGIYSSYHEIEEFAKKYVNQQILILVHCEDDDLIRSKAIKTNDTSLSNFVRVRSKTVELTAINKILRIARQTGAHFHIVHVSTVEAMQVINRLKYNNLVTCETCPQYLFLDNTNYLKANGEQYICTPPLRDKENNAKLIEGFKLNYFNIIASDHCPFTQSQKMIGRRFYDKAPSGLSGLDFIPYLTSNLFERDFEKAKFLQQKLSAEPAHLTGLYPDKGAIMVNSIADLVVVDFDNEHSLAGREGIYNPYSEITTKLNISKVMKGGEFVVSDGEIITSNPRGNAL